MTQDVLLTISGLHQMEAMENGDEENEPIEVITPASYYLKNDKHYIIYDEVVEGMPGVIKNKVKIIGNDTLEIMKSGITNAHMVFEKNKMNVTYYETPYGQMQVGVHTRDVDINVTEDLIQVEVEYGLDINHEAMADCRISMNIQPKHAADSVLK
ncbi:MAG: DUF1934 domain-containing protein [Bariatricus sp.]|nr:DUF1934 domain-containing protein [Bariatricus sp.]